ncbi:glycosyltransferase family 4 protein [Actinoplanes sp. NPDC026619]|uniref:glycosyltransferase family 4 protein n=1 Tax=Actinoplanes sp. NPDC026619 TaxID=3155798 RepID=UPI0033C437A0
MKPAILLAAPYYPPRTGGVENYVWNLAHQLRTRHDRRVVIATTAGAGEKTGRFDGEHGPVYRLGAPMRLSNTPVGLGWVRGLRRILQAERIGLVNGHAPVPMFADAAARAAGDTPFVLSYHTGRMRTGSMLANAVCATYERTVLARTAARARQIICASDYVAADQPELFAGRSTVITPGADLGLFTAGPVPAGPRIVFAASLEPGTAYKGLADLFRAVALLIPGLPGVHLDVLGSGSAAASYQDLAGQLGLQRHVTFHGRLEGRALAGAYARARVLALPTHYDSFPTVIIEAMACGRPVVSTRVGGVPSLVTHGRNGLLVEAGDIPALAEALGDVLRSDRLARQLGEAGRRHAERELSWEVQGDRTVEVFDRVLDAERRVRTVAVVAPYFPPKIGGVENYAERVAAAVHGSPEMRVVVITTNTAGWRSTLDVTGGVPVIRLGTWARLSNTPLSPLWPMQLRRRLRRFHVDVINVHLPVPGLGDLAIAVRGRRPVVLTYHAGSMRKGKPLADAVIAGYEQRVLPRAFARAGVLVAVSPASLASGYPGAVQITPGVDPHRFTAGPPPSTRARTLIYVGRMDRSSAWKGVDVLVRAFAAIGDLPGVRLRLIGAGDAIADLAGLARQLGVLDRVDFAGELRGDDLVAAMQEAAVAVLPSRSAAESFGMALIEAMSCGTPVIGSDIGGIPYVLTHDVTGLLVPPDDALALAGACRRVLTDGALADRLADAGRRHATQCYAWAPLMDRYLGIFRSLAAPSPLIAARSAANAGLAEPSARRSP